MNVPPSPASIQQTSSSNVTVTGDPRAVMAWRREVRVIDAADELRETWERLPPHARLDLMLNWAKLYDGITSVLDAIEALDREQAV